MPSANKMAPLLLVDFSPKLRCSSKACVMSPWHTDSTDGKARGPNGARGTCATMSSVDGGDMAPTPRGWR
jgi:hypothetical protein